MDIHIFWDGPHSIEEAKSLKDKDTDYGLYQIYGQHPMYGSSVLLYIGQANDQTLGKRLSQELWEYGEDPNNVQIYVGRLAGHQLVSAEGWGERITIAEKLLIYAHQPAYNTSNKNSLPEEDVLSGHIFNWGSHRNLYPEVSGKRHASSFDHISEEKIYSCESLRTR